MNLHPIEKYKAAYADALRGFSARTEAELTILLYHGVSKSSSEGIENYANKHVREDEFVGHLRYLQKNCHVLSMDEVTELTINNEQFPPNSVAITFDDGFANNAEVAAPILSDLALPATFYVSSGIIGTDDMFWVDCFEDCINRGTAKQITVPLEGVDQTFELTTADKKIFALEVIKGVCKRVPVADKDNILSSVEEQTGVTPNADAAENYRKLTWNQVREMDQNDLFIIAGHSVHHDILALQPERQMALDIAASIDLLAYKTGREQTHYSYPEGQAHHYNDQTIQILKEKGIICSPSAIMGMNPPGTDLFHLRRIMVGYHWLPLPHLDTLL